MATRPKAVIESRNGEKFSPITIAKNVLTDDGQNLHDILSDRKEDMMTPTIENSSSMFKVGQGDNVDYSSNVVNGAYEDMVLKGKTMVNCIQESSSKDVVLPYEFADGQYVTINDTKESGALGVELKGQTLVNLNKMTYPVTNWGVNANNNNYYHDNYTLTSGLIKPSTKYLLKIYGLSNLHDIRIMGTNAILTSANGGNYFFNDNGAIIMTSTEDILDYTRFTPHFQRRDVKNLTEQEMSNFKMIILEYQEGMEHWDIPYFEGMASCKMPILKSVNQLFDYSLITAPGGSLSFTNDGRKIRVDFNTRRDCYQHVDLTIPSGTYNVSFEVRGNVSSVSNMDRIHSSKLGLAFVGNSNDGWSGNAPKIDAQYVNLSQSEFTTVTKSFTFDESKKVTIYYHGWNDNPVGWCEFRNIRIVPQGKSSTLSLPEEVVLRSLPNGMCDTFNTRTGVYTQRVGEVFLNGSESWAYNPAATNKTLGISGFNLPVATTPNRKWYGSTLCDKMPVITSLDKVGVYNGQGLNILIKSDSTNVNTLKEILAKDPITVQYQLENPIVTKINLPSTLKSWNTTTHIYSEIPENTLYPILSHSNPTYPVILKPSTKYSIVANSYSNNHTNSAINFNLGGATASITVGSRVTTITTPSTLSNELLTMSGRGNKLNHVMVIEGDVVGDEPHFDGICDCKSPILSNVGKNLLPTELSRSFKHITGNQVVSSIDLTSFLNREAQYVIKLAIPKNVKIAKHYSSSSNDNESVLVSHGAINSNNTIARFTIPSNSSSYYLFVNEFGQSQSDYISDISELVTIELDTGNVPTEITPYKSNITTFDQKDGKTIVLRSLPNGVCDTLNVETGEYVQSIGEIVLDNSHSSHVWNMNADWSMGDIAVFWSSNVVNMTGNSVLCDKFPSLHRNELILNNVAIKEAIRYGVTSVQFFIRKSRLETPDVAGFKRWLSQNPVTIQYELTTPIVSTVDIQGFPYAYVNGHVQLSSDSIEQSLTPKVEYSVVTNRNGQIRSNQKMVERHQKQLDRLQAMILTNLVNTQYEQTLTNLKYDLKNVREEVK